MKKKTFAILMCAAVALTGATCIGAEEKTDYADSLSILSEDEASVLTETTVYRDESSITGYSVKFCFNDPDFGTEKEAQRVRLYGEWGFSDPDGSTIWSGNNVSPWEWQDGYTLWFIDHTAPYYDMEKGEDGLWSLTMPLPNGGYKYRFYIGGDTDGDVNDTTGCYMAYDPANPPYLSGLYEEIDPYNLPYHTYFTSYLYVPWDEEKQANTDRVEELAPRTDGRTGTVSFEKAIVEEGDFAGSESWFGIYLPYDFDPELEGGYNLLVMVHGGGEYEPAWLNSGLTEIMDNMIAEGRIEPTIVITPSMGSFDRITGETKKHDYDRVSLDNFIADQLIPYMAENYNVSADPNRHAFGGCSNGGTQTWVAYFNHPEEYRYYLPLSGSLPNAEIFDVDFTREELDDREVMIGVSLYDNAAWNFDSTEIGGAYKAPFEMAQAGLDFKIINEIQYGHGYPGWRIELLRFFDNFLWKADEEEPEEEPYVYSEEELAAYEAIRDTAAYQDAGSRTGYSVKFCYTDPNFGTDQEIVGMQVSSNEWKFSDPYSSTAWSGEGVGAEDWKNGYVIWSGPTTTTSSAGSATIAYDMETDGEGFWYVSVPLPNGGYKYSFSATLKDETTIRVQDPAHPSRTEGLDTTFSAGFIYVPYDPVKQSKNTPVTEMAPRTDGQVGEVFYKSLIVETDVEQFDGMESYFGIYLPYGFDPELEGGYNLMVVIHGGGESETAWLNSGFTEILDNMIAEGRMEPTIVVAPSMYDFDRPTEEKNKHDYDRATLNTFIEKQVLPYMIENYNVTTDPDRRCFGGVSNGGIQAWTAYFNSPETYRYFIACSGENPAESVGCDIDYTRKELHDRFVMIGVSLYDNQGWEPAELKLRGSYTPVFNLAKAGLDFKIINEIQYGHGWPGWRVELIRFIDKYLWKME